MSLQSESHICIFEKRLQAPSDQHLINWEKGAGERKFTDHTKAEMVGNNSKKGNFFAILVPVSFFIVVCYMIYTKFSGAGGMEGGEGAALIGGVAFLLLIATGVTNNMKESLEQVSKYIIDGLIFAFKAMGIVLPIAGFFFLGNDETAAGILAVSENAPAFLFELIIAGEHLIPSNGILAAFGILIIGMITGLDGSGFSGLPLTGALAGPLGATMGMDPATLAAIGQMGAIWVGGGTLIAWSSLVAVAGFAKVPVLELVRKCFFPVVIGLFISTVVAIIIF